MGVPITVYLCMAESSALFVSREGLMQESSVCWVGVRIVLVSLSWLPMRKLRIPVYDELLYQRARKRSNETNCSM